MSGQPFMYSALHSHSASIDSRFPEKPFDPKAATRASWEPKPKPRRHEGPLVSFNRHPDSHMVLQHRSNHYSAMGPGTKSMIKWSRRMQLFLRLLELNGAVGILVLMILLTQVDTATQWILRVAACVFICHCVYAIYHLSRPAAGRTPTTSMAYQMFSIISDLVVLAFYAFGAFTTHQNGDSWSTFLSGRSAMEELVPALYYLFIGAGGAHFLSLLIAMYLGIMFRKISLMPPDMNPLEDHLTARPKHKKSKSSISTNESEKRLSTPLEAHGRSGMPYEDVTRGPSVPFMHTRNGSYDSANLPARQYQVMPSNRNSVVSLHSNHVPGASPSYRTSYTEIPSVGSPGSAQGAPASRRPARFTETWIPTDSLISRTNNRHIQMAQDSSKHNSPAYSALPHPYSVEFSDDEDDIGSANKENTYTGDGSALSGGSHPNPLRQHPTSSTFNLTNNTKKNARAQTPFRPWASNSLTSISVNARRVSHSDDIADTPLYDPNSPPPSPPSRISIKSTPRKNTSLQLSPSPGRGQIYSGTVARGYDGLNQGRQLPVTVANGEGRKVSSGNDWEDGRYGDTNNSAWTRRNVSGKIAEEGRAASPQGGSNRSSQMLA